MKEFILASGNGHKALEFSEQFDSPRLKIIPASKKLEIEETGSTYFQNALIKAQAYYQLFKVPVISDDSGLNVEALENELGIYSARFGGPGLSDKERALLLLEKMKDLGFEKRRASFTCVLCFYLTPQEIYFFEGHMPGSIAFEYKGEHGFGYDPVFIPLHLGGEQTVAQDPSWKKNNCHRAHACQEAKKFFERKKIGCQN